MTQACTALWGSAWSCCLLLCRLRLVDLLCLLWFPLSLLCLPVVLCPLWCLQHRWAVRAYEQPLAVSSAQHERTSLPERQALVSVHLSSLLLLLPLLLLPLP